MLLSMTTKWLVLPDRVMLVVVHDFTVTLSV